MASRGEQVQTESAVPLCLMLSDDEDRNIRMMFEHPERLTAPRHSLPERKWAFSGAIGSFAGACAAALVNLRKDLI